MIKYQFSSLIIEILDFENRRKLKNIMFESKKVQKLKVRKKFEFRMFEYLGTSISSISLDEKSHEAFMLRSHNILEKIRPKVGLICSTI